MIDFENTSHTLEFLISLTYVIDWYLTPILSHSLFRLFFPLFLITHHSLQTNTVESVSADGHSITLVKPLSHTHHGITETFDDGQFIDIRSVVNVCIQWDKGYKSSYFILNDHHSAEVGLLSHNIIVQGSLLQSSSFEGLGADQYGGQIMIHRAGPHSTPIRCVDLTVLCSHAWT